MFLRDGTQDLTVFQEVFYQNEYNLPDEFDPEDVIIDIGAHIGVFALACLARGARRVLCYEPDRGNYAVLLRNLEPYPLLAEATRAAVWRSDRAEPVVLVRPPDERLTAMTQTRAGFKAGSLRVLGLDDILAPHQRVRMLKLDCEGAEYPILYTSGLLDRVSEIVGEAHEQIPWPDSPRPCSAEGVVAYLREQGFDAFAVQHPTCSALINWFFARRPTHDHVAAGPLQPVSGQRVLSPAG